MSKSNLANVTESVEARLADLVAKGEWIEVETLCEALPEASAEVLFYRALTALMMSELGCAASYGETAFRGQPDIKEVADLLALVYALAGELGNASYYRKLSTVLSSNPRFAALWPSSLPDFDSVFLNISQRPLFSQGLQALAEGNWKSAERSFSQQVTFGSHDRDTLLGLAVSQSQQNALGPAIDALQSLRHVNPSEAFVASELAGLLTRFGRFQEGAALHRAARLLSPNSASLAINALLDRLRDLSANQSDLAADFAKWGEVFGVKGGRPVLSSPAGNGPLTVACFVGACGAQRSSVGLTQTLVRMDPRKFRFIGLGFGALSHPANSVYQAAFDGWVDVAGADPVTFSHVVRAQNPDIVIDFVGLESPNYLTAFGLHLATVQLFWSNHPFNFGLAGFSGLISDRWTENAAVPNQLPVYGLEHGASFFSLPTETFPLSEREPGSPIVIGVDGNFSDMHPDLVEAWARILHALPNAQFLVKDRNFSEPANAQRLLEIFGIHGLAHRIEVVQDADTYGFFGQLDLLLLSAPLPAATQVLDALWSGVLPLALSVSNRVGRQAFALLDQLGLSKAVLADTLDDYVSKAIALAQDTAGRATLRSQMRNLLAKVPALDPEVRAKDLSAALDLAWEASKSSRGI